MMSTDLKMGEVCVGFSQGGQGQSWGSSRYQGRLLCQGAMGKPALWQLDDPPDLEQYF